MTRKLTDDTDMSKAEGLELTYGVVTAELCDVSGVAVPEGEAILTSSSMPQHNIHPDTLATNKMKMRVRLASRPT